MGDRSRERRRLRVREHGMSRRTFLLGSGIVGIGAAAGAVFWLPSGRASHAYTLAPDSALPANLRKAPPTVREAYRFAIANRDVLQQIPCYCGCGGEHQSNAECYIKEVRPDGQIDFDQMSFT